MKTTRKPVEIEVARFAPPRRPAVAWALLLVMLIAVCPGVGCRKAGSSTTPAGRSAIDLTKLRQSFPSSTVDFLSVNRIDLYLGAGNFDGALAELNKLAANPRLNAAQKQAVNDAVEQINKAPKPAR